MPRGIALNANKMMSKLVMSKPSKENDNETASKDIKAIWIRLSVRNNCESG
jgi:hypothetical protein